MAGWYVSDLSLSPCSIMVKSFGVQLDGILSSGIDIKRWSEDFFRIANQLVADRSADNTISKIKCIDIVRSVVNLVPVQWLENEMVGEILASDCRIAVDNFQGLCNDECSHQSRFEKFANIAQYVLLSFLEHVTERTYSYLYLNTLPEQEFILRKRAQESSRPLNEHIICKLRQNTKQPVSQSLTVHHGILSYDTYFRRLSLDPLVNPQNILHCLVLFVLGELSMDIPKKF